MAQIKHYLVGGAVRDRLLDLPVKDRDWVVTGATPQDMSAQGFRAVGKDFPVFLHPDTHEEYALARTERKIQAGYHGFQFNTHPDITLKQDLERRDLTINALAQDDQGQIFDYFNGQQDLEKRILRHTSPAFKEDPVRVLRVARFAARYADLGFRIAPETQALMKKMVATGEVDALVAERVWQETHSALNEKKPGVFFEVLRSCGALAILFPEVNQLFGVPQHAQYHPEIDSGLHTLMVLNRSAALSPSTAVRFSALTHDLGKGTTPKEEWPAHRQHEKHGVPLVKALCERYKVPNRLQQLAVLVTAQHLRIHRALELTPKKLLEVFEQCDAFRRPQRFMELLIACQADAQGRTGMEQKPYPQRTYFMALLQDCQQVETQAIIQQGYEGVAIREQLRLRRLKKIKAFKQSYHPSI